MKLNIRVLTAFLTIFMGSEAYAQQQEQPDIFEQAEIEADRLQRLLDLEDWQTFYVDSILKHDYSAMMTELQQFQKAKVSNTTMYINVQDKWRDKMDESFRRVFNDAQWTRYLKSGAGKAQKAREKRKAKAEGKK